MAVYFIEAVTSPMVKIGWSDNPHARLMDLRAAHFLELRIIRTINGRRGVECWLHHWFRANHVAREWFLFSPEMLTIDPAADAELGNLDRSFHEVKDQLVFLLNTRPDLSYAKIASMLGVPSARMANWVAALIRLELAPSRMQPRRSRAA